MELAVVAGEGVRAGVEGGRESLELLRLRGRVEHPDGCFREELPCANGLWVGVALLLKNAQEQQ